jgi:hypothetical protein
MRLSLFDDQVTITARQKRMLESWLSDVEMKCIGCGWFDANAVRPESRDPYALWVLQGKWRRQTSFGVVSTGFVGTRNSSLPLFTAMPIGGDVDPVTLGSSHATFVAPSSQWSLTAAFAKTLATSKGGASVGVTADALIPVKTESLVGGDPRISAMSSSAIRVGVFVRW